MPEDVIRVLQNQRVGAFINSVGGEGVAQPLASPEPAALVPPPPHGHAAGAMAGSDVINPDRQVNDIVKAVVVEDQESKVIGAIVGSRHVTNVVKTLQQVSTSYTLILLLFKSLAC